MVLLPLLLVLALAGGAAALAGFFDGDDGAATISQPPAPRVQAPVTTPLPIRLKVAKPAVTAPATAAGTATGATGDHRCRRPPPARRPPTGPRRHATGTP